MAEPILDLTLEARKTVLIDGTHYPLRTLDEFTLKERHQFVVLLRKIEKAAERVGEEDADEAVDRMAADLEAAVGRVLVGADAVLSKLSFGQQQRVIEVFFRQSGIVTPQAASKPPQGSSDSTEAPASAGGSTAPETSAQPV